MRVRHALAAGDEPTHHRQRNATRQHQPHHDRRPKLQRKANRRHPLAHVAKNRPSDDVIDFIENNRKGNYKKGLFILLFFISFALLGCIMQVGAYGFA